MYFFQFYIILVFSILDFDSNPLFSALLIYFSLIILTLKNILFYKLKSDCRLSLRLIWQHCFFDDLNVQVVYLYQFFDFRFEL